MLFFSFIEVQSAQRKCTYLYNVIPQSSQLMYPLPHIGCHLCVGMEMKTQDLPSWQISSIQHSIANCNNCSHHAVH